MRVVRCSALGLLIAALLVSSAGWYRSAHPGGGSRFDSCSFDGTTLTLRWTYGVDSRVSPSVDVRSGKIVVDLLRTRPPVPTSRWDFSGKLGLQSGARVARSSTPTARGSHALPR